MSFTSNYLRCAGRELHYTEWGAAHAETVIAWHGLARTGRDMDEIAAHLAQRWRVICPDTIGRGLSEWSPEPRAEYCLDFYARQAAALLDQLGLEQVHWLGTSMGGAIGLKAAAGALHGRIRRLVLNDIGPQLAAAAVERIRTYAGSPPAFATVTELEQYFRTVYKPYGAMTDAQWRRLTETSTLCLRGEHSDLLLPDVADAMRNRGPRAVVVQIAGCGHAPTLNTPDQFALVERFFAA